MNARTLTPGRPWRYRAQGLVHIFRPAGGGLTLFYLTPGGPFTLPAGRYLAVGGVKDLGPHISQQPDPLPYYPLPDRLHVVRAPNPNVATVYPLSGRVEVDPEALPFLGDAVTTFVLLHELGHYFAGPSEEAADLYAALVMEAEGWNPSQIEQGIRWTLRNNPDRARAVRSLTRRMRWTARF